MDKNIHENWIVGKNVRHLRLKRKMTLKELGKLSNGMSYVLISQYEHGVKLPGEYNIRLLAQGLKVKPGELFKE